MKLKCSTCNERTKFNIEGNIKTCTRCKQVTSYKHNISKRAVKRTRVLQRQSSGSNEQSPYWNWTFTHSHQTHEGEFVELAEANPDSLAEDQNPYLRCSDEVKEQFDNVTANIDKLSQREKEVVQLLWEGRSMREVATILQISVGAVQTFLTRSRKKLSCNTKGQFQS